MKLFRSVLIKFIISVFFVSISVNTYALVIGHYDSSREVNGLSTERFDLASQWLLDHGHTLAPTSYVDEGYLSGVDAFFSGLLSWVDNDEITAMQNFVDVNGGFLFIQQDHSLRPWRGSTEQILARWGISTSGFNFNSVDFPIVSDSAWVTEPNTLLGVSGGFHATINTAPSNLEVLVENHLGQAVLGVIEGHGLSGDVLISTDVNFWEYWHDPRNIALWENIWAGAESGLTGGSSGGNNGGSGGSNGGSGGNNGGNGGLVTVSEPSPFALFAIGIVALCFARTSRQGQTA